MTVQPQPGDMVVVGTTRWRIHSLGVTTVALRSFWNGPAIVARWWLEPEPEVRGFRRAWRSQRCIPTR